MVKWRIVYTKQAQKDAKKLASAGLRQKALNFSKSLNMTPFRVHRRMRSCWATYSGHILGESTSTTVWSIKFT